MFKVSLVIMGLILHPTFGKYFEECLDVAEDTLIPVANDCRAYIICSAEAQNSFKDACPEDTYFAAETGECLMDYDNICAEANYTTDNTIESKEVETTTAIVTTEVPTTTAATFTTLSLDSTKRPKCSPHTNDYYPHKEHCEYYYKCVAGYLTILRCNFYHAWDYHKEMCVPHNMVQCYGTAKLSNFKPKLPGKIVAGI